MSRLKAQVIWSVLIIAIWSKGLVAHRVNTTIYDTNLAHVTYSDVSISCNRWVNYWLFWKACSSWLKPWASGVYHTQGKIATFHSSLNNQLASVTIDFRGTDVWIYGPPLSRLANPPPDYKLCLYESYRLSPDHQCYQINVTEAYSTSEDEGEPVVVFARGQLPDNQHRVVISIADPADDIQEYSGIKFSHAVYTTERPTPWPVEEDRWRYREIVMHDTHPMLSYTPQPYSWFPQLSPWSAKIHSTEDGTVVSWHQLEVWNLDEGDRYPYRVETKIKAGAVAIYGVPSAYIEKPDSLGFVCVGLDSGLCELVDVKTTYSNQKEVQKYEPVLLWRNDSLDPSRETLVSVRFVKPSTGSEYIFPFKSINYFEEKEYSSLGPLGSDLVNVTVMHQDGGVRYNPGRHCNGYSIWGGCDSWFDPWTWREAGPLGSVLTYRSTISQHRVKEDPYVSLQFYGSAVYLYGAPNAYAGRPFAPPHVCINNVCRVIDVEQAYLHPPREDIESSSISKIASENVTVQDVTPSLSIPHPELEPVLFWSITGLDPNIEHTLRLALAALPSPDNAEMTIVKFVYTRVWDPRPPNPPPPGSDHVYAGPLHPPHATNWVPLDHKPPPPILIDISPPKPALPPFVSLGIALLVAYGCLRLTCGICCCGTDENQPLLPDPPPPRPRAPRIPNAQDMPPSYQSIMPSRPNGQR